MEKEYKFPGEFLWGAATSAHQIEGNQYNDWTEAEPKVPKNGKAADSYNRYEEDFDLAKNMGNNAHRFSIEWSRIEPREGEFDQKQIEHYRKVIRAARERGLEPFITLHHFTNPVWFARKGGWENRDSPRMFANFVGKVIAELGAEANYWITINEPLIYAMIAHGIGKWPPFGTDFFDSFRVAKHFADAHKQAYPIIKAINPEAKVGIAKNNNYYSVKKSGFFRDLLSGAMVKASDYFWNNLFFNTIDRHQDFIGINYYNHNRIKVGWANPESWYNQPPENETSDFGWEVYPAGIYYVVKSAAKYKKPIYILENGTADADDNLRPQFIKDHLAALHKAIGEGVDVRGYFHWSLLDNYEWAEGYKMKFGLVEVDFETMERKPRGSYNVYKRICETNRL